MSFVFLFYYCNQLVLLWCYCIAILTQYLKQIIKSVIYCIQLHDIHFFWSSSLVICSIYKNEFLTFYLLFDMSSYIVIGKLVSKLNKEHTWFSKKHNKNNRDLCIRYPNIDVNGKDDSGGPYYTLVAYNTNKIGFLAQWILKWRSMPRILCNKMKKKLPSVNLSTNICLRYTCKFTF